jgi:hypothetical protein
LSSSISGSWGNCSLAMVLRLNWAFLKLGLMTTLVSFWSTSMVPSGMLARMPVSFIAEDGQAAGFLDLHGHPGLEAYLDVGGADEEGSVLGLEVYVRYDGHGALRGDDLLGEGYLALEGALIANEFHG